MMTDDTRNDLASAVNPPSSFAKATADKSPDGAGAAGPPFTLLRDILAANRQPVFRGEQYSHPRGWNDALDYVERVMKNIEIGKSAT